jgi:hypothetical protein
MTGSDGRHLSPEGFRSYLRAGVPIDHPIEGEPKLILFIDPSRRRIGLRAPATNEASVAISLENVGFDTVYVNGRRHLQLEISDPSLFTDAYPVLCAVADRVQLDGQTFGAAISSTFRKLGHLLRAEDALSREAETGLVGELAFLAGMIRTYGPTDAVRAWRGGQGEEHDFGCPDADLEVKTTSSEQRVHWISSLTQLVPTNDRLLLLVSIQITRAGVGGRSLSNIVQYVRSIAMGERDTFDDRLATAGWRERHAESATQRWRARTQPSMFVVDERFPRLTVDLLRNADFDLAVISDVRYRLDLTTYPPSVVPVKHVADALDIAHQELA